MRDTRSLEIDRYYIPGISPDSQRDRRGQTGEKLEGIERTHQRSQAGTHSKTKASCCQGPHDWSEYCPDLAQRDGALLRRGRGRQGTPRKGGREAGALGRTTTASGAARHRPRPRPPLRRPSHSPRPPHPPRPPRLPRRAPRRAASLRRASSTTTSAAMLA